LTTRLFSPLNPWRGNPGNPSLLLLLGWLKRVSSSAESEFDRLMREEAVLREKLLQSGRQFAASSRLTRDELHDRHGFVDTTYF
jgi:hypothetical protein